jgi:recombination protein RecR
MTGLEKLIKNFEKFPGIGSRQAKRFAFHLLTQPEQDVAELSELIKNIKSTVVECPSCFRFHSVNGAGNVCSICSNNGRDASKLTIVERDVDIDAIERGGAYDGLYFVLGGTVPLLDNKDTSHIRGGQLKARVEKDSKNGLQEIILAFSVNPDGENTSRYIEMLLKDYIEKNNLKVTYLGRGLSTGSELEYADPETIKEAFANRH